MKKLLALSVIGTSLIIGSNPVKADWDVWTIKESATSGVWDIYALNSATQEATKRTQVCKNKTAGCPQWYQKYVDPDSLNRKLDPNFHQAMIEIEDDQKEPGTIIQEIQKGFTIKDRLLRPSLVGVSKKTENKVIKDEKNNENQEDK